MNQMIEVAKTGIQLAFSSLEDQLREMEVFNSSISWDYRDSADQKEAGSYIRKLQVLKNDVDRKRKDVKSEIDEYGKGLVRRLEDMIEVHKVPLDRERQRVKDIEERIEQLKGYAGAASEHEPSTQLKSRLACLQEEAINADEFQEFYEIAATVKAEGMKTLALYIEIAEKREDEEAELARLREAEGIRRAQQETVDHIHATLGACLEPSDSVASARKALKRVEGCERMATEDAIGEHLNSVRMVIKMAKNTLEGTISTLEEAENRPVEEEEKAPEPAVISAPPEEPAEEEPQEAKKPQWYGLAAGAIHENVPGISYAQAEIVIDVILAGDVPFVKVVE